MTPFVADPDFTLYVGEALDVLRELPDESVHCVVTSPPYWGLRDYGTGSWAGGDPDCDHLGAPFRTKSNLNENWGAGFSDVKNAEGREPMGQTCSKCGATRTDQQLGLESTPEAYVARMVEVFREVRRVLRRDGTCWLNLGDSYSGVGGTNHDINGGAWKEAHGGPKLRQRGTGLKQKDLVGIPWRLAFALQADGWCLRSDVIWSKPNPMPESVTDRPTKAHEYLFLLTPCRWSGGIEPWPMTREDAIWLAALVDGEGTICFQEQARKEWAATISCRLSIVNTNRALLERVSAITNIDENTTPSPRPRGDGSPGRPVFTWQVTNEKAARIIAAIRPHLIAKQIQAELALYVHTLNQKHKGRGDHRTTDADLAAKRKAAAACSALNHGEEVDLGWFKPVRPGRWMTPKDTFYDADAIREPAEWARWGDQTNGKHEGSGSAAGWIGAKPKAELGRPQQRRAQELFELHGLTEVHKQAIRDAGLRGDPAATYEIAVRGAISGRELVNEAKAALGSYYREFLMETPGRNARSVWEIATQPYAEAHFATFPEELPRRCIAAGCPTDGTVLDPFIGSGTTALVARKLGRRSIGIELNPDYAELAARRLNQLSLLAEEVS